MQPPLLAVTVNAEVDLAIVVLPVGLLELSVVCSDLPYYLVS